MISKKGLRFSGIGMIDFYDALRGAAKIRGNENYSFTSEKWIKIEGSRYNGQYKKVVLRVQDAFKNAAFEAI
jgi:hypothetical protein